MQVSNNDPRHIVRCLQNKTEYAKYTWNIQRRPVCDQQRPCRAATLFNSVVVKTTLTETKAGRDRAKTKTLKFFFSDVRVTIEVYVCPRVRVSTAFFEPAPWGLLSLICWFAYEFSVIKVAKLRQIKNQTANDFCYWLRLKKKVIHPVTAITVTNLLWSWLIFIKNSRSATSETETRSSQNAFHSETRPWKNGCETGLRSQTNLQY